MTRLCQAEDFPDANIPTPQAWTIQHVAFRVAVVPGLGRRERCRVEPLHAINDNGRMLLPGIDVHARHQVRASTLPANEPTWH